MMIGVTFAGEKYCFKCHHKYKIGDKENATYDFEFDLQTNKLSVKVKEQISINREEAKHTSVFVSGWRPATGWICVAGMGFNFIAVPIGNFACALAGIDVIMPNLDLGEMMPVLLGMLGLGAMRTVEKTKKVARD